jgi:hypothetical protein
MSVGQSGENRALRGRQHPRVVGEPRLAALPRCQTLTITADCGGGNSNRVHLLEGRATALGAETGLEIQACHFPPGTSKWNSVAIGRSRPST